MGHVAKKNSSIPWLQSKVRAKQVSKNVPPTATWRRRGRPEPLVTAPENGTRKHVASTHQQRPLDSPELLGISGAGKDVVVTVCLEAPPVQSYTQGPCSRATQNW